MNGLAILIIEDHRPTSNAMHRLLRSDHPQTVTVSTITAARALLQCQQFDLIITDLHLSDGDGLQFIQELRQHREVRAIAVSGSTFLDTEACREMGFVECLKKPIEFDQLLRAIDHAMKQANPAV